MVRSNLYQKVQNSGSSTWCWPETHQRAVEAGGSETPKEPQLCCQQEDGRNAYHSRISIFNQNTHIDKFLMTDVQECIDKIGRMWDSIFSTFDLTSSFCVNSTMPKIHGLHPTRVGLSGVSGSFHKLMEIFIHNLTNILAYIKDLLVHTKDHNKHLEIWNNSSFGWEDMDWRSTCQNPSQEQWVPANPPRNHTWHGQAQGRGW